MVVKDLMSRLHDDDTPTVLAAVASLDKVRRPLCQRMQPYTAASDPVLLHHQRRHCGR